MNLTLKMMMMKKMNLTLKMMMKKMKMTMTMKEILKTKLTLMKKMVMLKTKDEEGFGQRVKTCFTHLLQGEGEKDCSLARGRGRGGVNLRKPHLLPAKKCPPTHKGKPP